MLALTSSPRRRMGRCRPFRPKRMPPTVPSLRRTWTAFCRSPHVRNSPTVCSSPRQVTYRRRRLERLKGWVWDPFKADWEQSYAHLTAYVKAEGDARVPRGYRTRDGYRLGLWVSHQRAKRKALSADQRKRLQRLKGWVWDARPSRKVSKKK